MPSCQVNIYCVHCCAKFISGCNRGVLLKLLIIEVLQMTFLCLHFYTIMPVLPVLFTQIVCLLLQELLCRTALETQKLELMSEVSNLKLKLNSMKNERLDFDDGFRDSEVN